MEKKLKQNVLFESFKQWDGIGYQLCPGEGGGGAISRLPAHTDYGVSLHRVHPIGNYLIPCQ